MLWGMSGKIESISKVIEDIKNMKWTIIERKYFLDRLISDIEMT